MIIATLIRAVHVNDEDSTAYFLPISMVHFGGDFSIEGMLVSTQSLTARASSKLPNRRPQMTFSSFQDSSCDVAHGFTGALGPQFPPIVSPSLKNHFYVDIISMSCAPQGTLSYCHGIFDLAFRIFSLGVDESPPGLWNGRI